MRLSRISDNGNRCPPKLRVVSSGFVEETEDRLHPSDHIRLGQLFAMSFQPLQQLLGSLENQIKRPEEKQLQQVIRKWAEVVGAIVSQQTRPIAIQRGTLKVATSNAVWSQNLVFERQRILEKLNAILSTPISDIRFSTTDWHKVDFVEDATEIWAEHPSRVEPVLFKLDKAETPEAAFQNWLAVVQHRSDRLPLCPQCQCPTPIGELDRWSICALCVSKRW
jgi:predicted nucleic acid-binding Zn ribbon protein